MAPVVLERSIERDEALIERENLKKVRLLELDLSTVIVEMHKKDLIKNMSLLQIATAACNHELIRHEHPYVRFAGASEDVIEAIYSFIYKTLYPYGYRSPYYDDEVIGEAIPRNRQIYQEAEVPA